VKSRILQEQTLEGDQKRYRLGAVVTYQVVQDQRDLANAQSAEVQSMANYTHARIALEQALGTTLEANHISLAEALGGQLSRVSMLPPEVPREERQ
jgi:outer membrane protein